MGFGILKFFVLTNRPCVHTEVDGPGNLQEYKAFNMKKKIDPEGLGKGAVNVKKWMENQSFVSDGSL